MNINNLQIQLQNAVVNANTQATTDNTSTTLYYLQLAKAIQSFRMGQVRTIDTFSNLPTASTKTGWLYFILDVDRLYFSNGTVWSEVAPVPVYTNRVWSWGQNQYGQLGDCTALNKSSPVSVMGGFTNWCQISAGGHHSAGIRQNGTAWGWGFNGIAVYYGAPIYDTFIEGRLGLGPTDFNQCRLSPVSVVGGFTDWCQISAGTKQSLAVRQNGTIWGWGYGCYGVLGNGGYSRFNPSPVSVIGGFTDWRNVATGYKHTMGLKSNGTTWAWGKNEFGQLGDNTVANKYSPVSVVGGFTDWCQISAGKCHSVAVRQNGTLWSWGNGINGRLGDNTTTDKSSPVSVVGGFTDWCQVSAGAAFSLAVRTGGTAWAWGLGTCGRLGDNTTTDKSSPVSVIGGFTNWCQLSGGDNFSLGVRQNGTIWAWGQNNCGQLGQNNTTDRSSPVLVTGGFTDWCQAAAGECSSFSLGIRSTL